MNPLPFFLLSYLLGSIPFALLIALPKGVDPRKEGSKNPGATNVARLLGKKWGLLTFLGDAGKGILAIGLAYALSGHTPAENPFLYSGVAFFAVFGHMYSIFLKFKGGKGVATTIGTFLILAPLPSLIALSFFLLAVFFTGFVSVGSLTFATLLPLLLLLFNFPKEYLFSGILLGLLIFIKHRENIKRLIKGQEKSWRKRLD